MNQALVKKIKIINILRDEGKSFWNLETGNWSQELETGNWKLETGVNGQWTMDNLPARRRFVRKGQVDN